MAGCQKITYQGKEILFADHTGLRGEAFLDNIRHINQMVLAEAGEVLLLVNFTNTYISQETVNLLTSETSKQVAHNTKKLAVLGVTGIKKMFLTVYKKATGIRPEVFTDLQAAKEYLVS